MRLRNLLLSVVLLAASAFGQTVTGSRFTATFNAPVETKTYRNDANTSTRTEYASISADGVYEEVTEVKVDHDIEVGYDSTRFYRNQGVANLTPYTDKFYDGTYQGRLFSFGSGEFVPDGSTKYTLVGRFFVLDNRTALFIEMAFPQSLYAGHATDNGAFDRWAAFEESLNIQ